MPWTPADFPASMKNLDIKTRNKAIEVANALLHDGYDEGRAIPIAISTAKKWAAADNDDPEMRNPDRDLHVVPHPDGWAVRGANRERASFVFPTMEEARDKALDMAQTSRVNVILHNELGRFEDVLTEDEQEALREKA